jgi:hypothetical protein
MSEYDIALKLAYTKFSKNNFKVGKLYDFCRLLVAKIVEKFCESQTYDLRPDLCRKRINEAIQDTKISSELSAFFIDKSSQKEMLKHEIIKDLLNYFEKEGGFTQDEFFSMFDFVFFCELITSNKYIEEYNFDLYIDCIDYIDQYTFGSTLNNSIKSSIKKLFAFAKDELKDLIV